MSDIRKLLISTAVSAYNSQFKNKIVEEDFSVTCVDKVDNVRFSFDVYTKNVKDELRIRIHCTYDKSTKHGTFKPRLGDTIIKSTGINKFQLSTDLTISEVQFPIKELSKICKNKEIPDVLVDEDGTPFVLNPSESYISTDI